MTTDTEGLRLDRDGTLVPISHAHGRGGAGRRGQIFDSLSNQSRRRSAGRNHS